MPARKLVAVVCNGCGDQRQAFKGERIFHGSCPRRQPRRAIPEYLPADTDEQRKESSPKRKPLRGE